MTLFSFVVNEKKSPHLHIFYFFLYVLQEVMIYMNDKNLNLSDLESKIVGGGVIPVSIVNGEVQILLGKERYINHWRGSLKWSGFEGGRKFNENIHNTVCREFMEESLGVVNLKKTNENTLNYIDSVNEIIKNKEYFMQIILCINHENGEQIDKRYQITYVIEVPYNTKCIEDFNDIRKVLVDIHFKLNQFRKLMDSIIFEYPFIMKDSIVDNNSVLAISDISFDNDILVVKYMDTIGTKKELREKIKEEMQETAIAYTKWFSARVQLHNEITKISHLSKSFEVTYDSFGLFENGRINDEYLEKQYIQWWSMTDLKEVLKNGGFHKNEFFRAYFLPVLQRSIEELEKYYPQRNSK